MTDGQLAVGAAAFGHPLQVGLGEELASCSRAAAALLDGRLDGTGLSDRYLHRGIFDLLDDARCASRSLRWLLLAGARAPAAFARGSGDSRPPAPFSAGILGLSLPTPAMLLRRARWQGLKGAASRWVGRAPAPSGAEPRPTEANLFYVVDDDRAVREALRDYLEAQGAEVICFADELSLFAAVAQRPPQAIVLDVVLSWVDGLRLCEGLRQHPLTRATRVVVMSGLDRPLVRARALAAGAAAFLPKPFAPALLWSLLSGKDPAPAAPQLFEGALGLSS